MSKKKVNLICYNRRFIRNTAFVILPALLFSGFFVYNGRKFDLFIVSSFFLLFLTFNHFISSTRFGPIHMVSKKKTNLKKKAKKK